MRRLARRLRAERGDGLIDTLLILTVVLFLVVVTIQTLLYVHARSIATGAAQDGARAAATSSSAAGLSRVTVEVAGEAPRVFPVGFAVPRVRASATLPLERYSDQERMP